jgi:hypothetical protein
MQESIDQILDLAINFLTTEYEFEEVNSSLRFIKADEHYKKIGGNDYRGVQVLVEGIFSQEGTIYHTPEVALLVYADATYEEAIARALKEIQNPGDHTRWSIERLIIAPCIEKAKQAELV